MRHVSQKPSALITIVARRLFRLYPLILLTVLAATAVAKPKKAQEPSTTSSGPIAISPDDQTVWTVNPDNNSVSVFNVAGDANTKTAEIAVGEEPRFVTLTPDGKTVYVSNSRSGTVTE